MTEIDGLDPRLGNAEVKEITRRGIRLVRVRVQVLGTKDWIIAEAGGVASDKSVLEGIVESIHETLARGPRPPLNLE